MDIYYLPMYVLLSVLIVIAWRALLRRFVRLARMDMHYLVKDCAYQIVVLISVLFVRLLLLAGAAIKIIHWLQAGNHV